MIRIALVEDEEKFVEQLMGYFADYQNRNQEELKITVYSDGDAVTEKYKPVFDIIFMDIGMKFMDGMSAAKEIRRQDAGVIIIFITNMVQYAMQGYEVNALDYMLKPVSYDRFSQSMEKAVFRVKKHNNLHSYITVSLKGGDIVRLDVGDVYYIESHGHNIVYHTAYGDYLSIGSMKALEQALEEFSFVRGNSSYLINLQHVEGMREKSAVVKGKLVPLSRAKRSFFLQEFTKYWGG